MDDDVKILIWGTVITIFITGLLVILLIGFGMLIVQGGEYLSCQNLQEVSELEHHWDFWNGCLVKYNGYWFQPENFPYKELEIK